MTERGMRFDDEIQDQLSTLHLSRFPSSVDTRD